MDNDILLECDSLVKIYKTDDVEVMALQGLDLEVRRGEIIAVIGKSGSGKSTLMNLLGGLERPTAGKLLFEGKNLFDYSDKDLEKYRKSEVGFVWQKSGRNLLPYLTSYENVMAPMLFTDKSEKEIKERADMLLSLLQIDQKRDSYPSQMSGGEQQRVAIAVALANEPKLLLADEPTGAVDYKTSLQIQELFRKINSELGITIVIVTHDISLADRVGRIIMISDGKISSEKIRKRSSEDINNILDNISFDDSLGHEEYSVLDKAGRVQLTADMLEKAGIDSKRVKIDVVDSKIVITKE